MRQTKNVGMWIFIMKNEDIIIASCHIVQVTVWDDWYREGQTKMDIKTWYGLTQFITRNPRTDDVLFYINYLQYSDLMP